MLLALVKKNNGSVVFMLTLGLIPYIPLAALLGFYTKGGNVLLWGPGIVAITYITTFIRGAGERSDQP